MRPLQQSLDVNLAVTDSKGQPAANTAVTVAAVDEGIRSLTNFTTPDPLAYFTSDRSAAGESAPPTIFDMLMPEVPDGERAVGGDRGSLARHITPIVAHRFKPVALAWQTVHTDANGLARTSFSVPEFEGRLRVMAIAYHTDASGHRQHRCKAVTVLARRSWLIPLGRGSPRRGCVCRADRGV